MKWYIELTVKNMSSLGWAVYPFLALRDKEDTSTRIHEEVHLKNQLTMFVLPWLLIYGICYLSYDYDNNPFEKQASLVEAGVIKYRPFGWIKYLYTVA